MDKKGIGRALKVKVSEKPSHENAVGQRVKIFWDGENQWFVGTVTGYDSGVDEYQVVYDLDGQTTWERFDDIVFLSPEEDFPPLPVLQPLPDYPEDDPYTIKRPRKPQEDSSAKRRKVVPSDDSVSESDGNQDYSQSSDSEDGSDSSSGSDSDSNPDKKAALTKRRKPPSTRPKAKSNYKEDMDTEDSESAHEKPKKKQGRKPNANDDTEEPQIEDNSPENILGMRASATNETEFLIKFKGKSYRNCQWMSQLDFETKYPLSKGRLKKFLQSDLKHPARYANNNKIYFNNDFTIVDSVLDEADTPEGKKYLVKWRGLAFELSTWELEADLTSKEDKDRIDEYLKHRTDLLKNSKKYLAAHKVANSRTPLNVDQIKVPTFKSNQFELKDFQVDGFTWLAFNWHQHRNCMLADEMGLGKTVQTISLLQYMHQRYDIHGPFLIVSPLSTLGNWFKEFRRWTNMHAIVFHGTKQSRDIIKEHCWNLRDNKGNIVKGAYQFDAIITSYEMVLTESKLLQTVDWHCLILDEGHRIKNTDSKSLGKLKSFKSSHKVILTGTPLQNNLKELWTMLNFLDEATFNSADNFLKEYSNLNTNKEAVESLHKLLAPYLLRRLKEDVDKSIPVKEETLIEVELTSIQKAYYRAVLDRNREFLARGVKSKSNMPKLTNILMQLRKICNHPFLIKGAEEYVAAHQAQQTKPTVELNLVQCSGKMVLLDKLLPKLKEGNHKVLIFSQMVMMLDIVEDYLLYRGYRYERIDGTVRGSERQERIDRFCDSGSNDDSFVFLCTTRAGGVGINLTVADTVIIFDSDWNPQNDLQAQSRCHRIGQTSNVKVYRLITRNTYERHMFDVASKKLQLDHTVLSANAASTVQQEKPEEGIEKVTDAKQVEQMLRLNAMQLFNESNAEESEKEKSMLEEDIDSILQRASTITYSNTQNETNNNNNSNFAAFSKVTFAASDRENHVDLDDAHFWDKIMPQQQQGVTYLRQLLADTESLKTKEGKDALISRITKETQQLKHMNEVLDLMFQRLGDKEVENKDNELTQMLSLLEDIDTMGIFDAPEHLSVLKQCKGVLDRPRLRGRKKRNITDNLFDAEGHELDASGSQTNLGEDGKKKKKKDFSDDEYEGESDEEASDGGSDGKGAPSGYQWHTSGSPWRKVHRDKLKSTILQFGYGRWELFQKLAIFAKNSTHEIQAYTECFVQHCINTDYSLMGESHFDLWYVGLPPEVVVAYDTANLCRIILKDTIEAVQQEISLQSMPALVKNEDSNNNGTSDNNIAALLKAQSSSSSFFPGEHLKVSVEFPEAKPPSGAPLFIVISYQDASSFLFGPASKEVDYFGCYVRAYPLDSSLTADIALPGFVGNYSLGLVYSYGGKPVKCNVASQPTFSIKLDPTLDPNYQQLLQRNASTNTKRLLLLRDLLLLFQFKSSLITQLPDISRGPTEWWTSQCDKLLLKLAYEYGYCTSKNFMAMKEEFANAIPSIPDEQFPPPKLLAKRLHRIVSWLVTREQRSKKQQQAQSSSLPASVASQLQHVKPGALQDGSMINSMMHAVAHSDKHENANDAMDTDHKGTGEEPLMIYVRFNNEFILFKVHANLPLKLVTDKLKDMDSMKRDVQVFTENGTELLPTKKIGEYNLVNNQTLTAKAKSVKLQLTLTPVAGLNLPNALPVRKYTIKATDTLELLMKHYFQNYAYPLPAGVDLLFMFQDARLKPSQVAEAAGLKDGDTIFVTLAVKKLKVTLVMPNRLLQPAEFARKEPFGSIIQTICQKFSLPSVKLYHKERRILDTECSEDLNIQDEDFIVVAVSDAINILVPSLEAQKATIEYKIYIDKPLQLLMKDYCSRFKMAEDQIKFAYNNLVLKPHDTPCSIGLNEGYSIIPSIAYFNVVVKSRAKAQPLRQDTFTIGAKDNMKVLFQAVAQKWGFNPNDLDFFFLNRKVEPTYLPTTLKITNGSELIAHYVNEIEEGSNGLGDEMKVVVESGHQRPVTFILYSSSPLEKMIEVYPRVLKLKENQTIQFFFNGRMLQSCNTPFGVGMKDGDSVQAVVRTLS